MSPVSVRLNSRLVPLLVLLLLGLQLTVPYKGWMIGLVALGGLWLVSYGWARTLAQGLSLTREMRFGWTQVGDRLEERFTLYNDSFVPALWVEVQDHSTMPDYAVSAVAGVETGASNWWTTSGTCTRRGVYTLGPTSLQSGDPFGLYTVTVYNPATSSVLVTPPILPLPAIEVAAGGRTGEGRPRPFALERTLNSAGSRAYQPGDDLRWIHWRVSARQGDLHVRIFDGAPAGDWWIVLDLDEQAQAGEGWTSTEEHSVLLAASLADRGLREKRNVGLVTGGAAPAWVPPQQGELQRLTIMRALAMARPAPQRLAALLVGSRQALGRQASLILVTAAVDGDWIAALMPLVQRGMVPTVLLLDRASYGGKGDAEATRGLLAEIGVACHIIPRALLDRPEARPGHQGEWEWAVTPGGRAVLKDKPGDLTWKPLR